MDCVWHVTTRNDLHFKLVFFDFDVRLTDACSEADFVEVKTGGSLLKSILSVYKKSEIHHSRVYSSQLLTNIHRVPSGMTPRS